MEEVFEFTKSQLAEAFAKWNKDVKDNPGDFVDNSESGIKEANTLLSYLKDNYANTPNFPHSDPLVIGD